MILSDSKFSSCFGCGVPARQKFRYLGTGESTNGGNERTIFSINEVQTNSPIQLSKFWSGDVGVLCRDTDLLWMYTRVGYTVTSLRLCSINKHMYYYLINIKTATDGGHNRIITQHPRRSLCSVRKVSKNH